jgi:predicted RNase H-like HicB family nuclease
VEEVNIREAIELHLEGMLEAGEAIPEPSAAVAYVEMQVA